MFLLILRRTTILHSTMPRSRRRSNSSQKSQQRSADQHRSTEQQEELEAINEQARRLEELSVTTAIADEQARRIEQLERLVPMATAAAEQRGAEQQNRREGQTTPTATWDRMDRMEDSINRLSNVSRRPQFSAPRYSGETDVELFISMFLDVADANGWTTRETTLHLRASLDGPAITSGQEPDIGGILEDLRGRFGISKDQAKDRLDKIRRGQHQSLRDYGTEIKKLVRIAYGDQDETFRRELGLEKFKRGLNNTKLRQHMLHIPHNTIPEAIRIATDYLQIEENTTVKVISQENTTSRIEAKLDAVLAAIEAILKNGTDQGGPPQRPQAPDYPPQYYRTPPYGTPRRYRPNRPAPAYATQPTPTRQPPGPCYYCEGPHLRRNCRKYYEDMEAKTQTNQDQQQPQSGNDRRPTQ